MSRLTCGAAAAFALVLGCAGQPASPPPAPPVPLAQAVAARVSVTLLGQKQTIPLNIVK